MQKTIYLKESDAELWERAQRELGGSISSLFADCLRERLQRSTAESKPAQMRKLHLIFWNESEEPVVIKSFLGRWLVSTKRELAAGPNDLHGQAWDLGYCWAIAQTQKGNIAVYKWHCNDRYPPTLEVHSSLDELEGRVPQSIIAEAAAELGVPYEIELDI